MTPKNEPQNDQKKYPPKWPLKKNFPVSCTQGSRTCWNQHHQIYEASQSWIFYSKLMRFPKQISKAIISAPVRDNPSKDKKTIVSALKITSKLVPTGESKRPQAETILLFRVHIWAQKICLRYWEPFEHQLFWSSAISNRVCTTNNLDSRMLWTNKLWIFTQFFSGI